LSRRRNAGERIDIDYDSFGIALPMDQIVSANRFEPQIYRRYFDRPGNPAQLE